MVSRAIVAGGGIGGIPAAIALCKAGFEVKVGIPMQRITHLGSQATCMHPSSAWCGLQDFPSRRMLASTWVRGYKMHAPLIGHACSESVSSCTSHTLEVGEFVILQGYV